MDDLTDDPGTAVARLEQRIEALAAKVEGCRKYEAAARLALVLGGLLFAGLLLGLIQPDPLALLGAIAASLGGLVMLGSNGSTRREALAQLAAAEGERAALIGEIDLHVVDAKPTLH